jgi:hypothetical protein
MLYSESILASALRKIDKSEVAIYHELALPKAQGQVLRNGILGSWLFAVLATFRELIGKLMTLTTKAAKGYKQRDVPFFSLEVFRCVSCVLD